MNNVLSGFNLLSEEVSFDAIFATKMTLVACIVLMLLFLRNADKFKAIRE